MVSFICIIGFALYVVEFALDWEPFFKRLVECPELVRKLLPEAKLL